MKNVRNADDYLAWIKSVIALCPEVVNVTIIREESQTDKGLWRYRLTLKDGSFLEMFEFLQIASGQVEIIQYSLLLINCFFSTRFEWKNLSVYSMFHALNI